MTCRFLSVLMVKAALLLAAVEPGVQQAATAQQPKASTAETPAQVVEKSVTVFPISVTPGENMGLDMQKRIAEVVGMLLERVGIEQVELAGTPFARPDTDDPAKVAAAFGRFAAEQAIGTEYALFGEFVGTPKTGVQAIWTILVDKHGKVILAQRDDKRTFSRTSNLPLDCPVSCSVFVAKKVQKFWGLEDPLRKDAPAGKLQTQWAAKTGLPSEDQRSEMKKRLQIMKQQLKTSKLTIYPVYMGANKRADKQAAAQLAGLLTEQHICRAGVSSANPRLQIKGSPNEQEVLWRAARGFREFLRENPPPTPYALYADYGMGSHRVHHVHFIVCDRAGDWVLVDYQNSHHPDFQEIDPKSTADCNHLVVKRLQAKLSD